MKRIICTAVLACTLAAPFFARSIKKDVAVDPAKNVSVREEAPKELTEAEAAKAAQKAAAKEARDAKRAARKQARADRKAAKSAAKQAKKDLEQADIDGTLDPEDPNVEINPKTGFPQIKKIPFVMFDEGASFSMITRLQKQEERSNFVWQDYLVGAYFSVRTENMKPINSMVRVAAYYPFYHTFDGMQQYPKQTVLYAFDLLAAPMIQTSMWDYVRLNFAGGLHYMYQLTDEYHMNYLGLGLLTGVELPIARHWTIMNDGTFTLDYANLGTNQKVQPFDYSWQYQVSLGVRYSKKGYNKYSYIHKIKRAEKPAKAKSKRKAKQKTELEIATEEIDGSNAQAAQDNSAKMN